ncbi:MAG: hypothetical protein JO029_02150 [Candidatus Eremiobacteraeota bacterium]|nr:hypothetical protein [Candidatus Eremiobacteraeota bacterium]MBV8433063.1 hypothetical protein [Candidatus Eremiobacteraeota bacterium]
MRFSFIRTGVVATAASVALAACGGHGYVPSQSINPGGPATFNVISDAANPCYTAAVQPAWIFKGSCVITKLTSKGLKISLPAYKGDTEKVTLPGGNNDTGQGFVLVDALGGSDIGKYKGKAFPSIPSSTGKSALYVEAVNGFAGLKFPKGNLVFSTATKKLPGKSCALSILQKSGSKFSWFKTPIVGAVKGGTVTYTIPGAQLGILFANGLPAGPLFFDVACK